MLNDLTAARTSLAIIALLAPLSVLASEQPPLDQMPLETPAAKLSYALGMDVASSLKQLGQEIDLHTFVRAVGDVLEGKQPLLTAQQAHEVKQEAFAKIRQKQLELRQVQAQDNQRIGQAFLAKNKAIDGVITTDSGLQYTVLREGEGEKPSPMDHVTVHYRGTLLDGTEFDSSYNRGEPATFPVNAVIAGWTEALQLMNVGSSYKLFIPPELGYGQQGAGAQIGPNATLVFEVELLDIEKSPVGAD